jgi:hypothetical protein
MTHFLPAHLWVSIEKRMDSLITIESMYSRNSRFLLAKQRERNLASSSMSAARKEAPMKEKRTLGSSGQSVTSVGLGCMGFSHAYGAPTEHYAQQVYSCGNETLPHE